MPDKKSDPVNSPSHYTQGGRECIDLIRDALGPLGFQAFCLGNEMKYRHRAGLKVSRAEDLAKARWYERMGAGDDPRKSSEQFARTVIAPAKNDAE